MGQHGLDGVELLSLVVGGRCQVTTDDEQVAPCTEVAFGGPSIDQGDHSLDRREPSDRDRQRKVAALGRQLPQQDVELGQGLRGGGTHRTVGDARSVDGGHAHALGNDRHPVALCLDVEVHQGAHVVLEGGPWEEDEMR